MLDPGVAFSCFYCFRESLGGPKTRPKSFPTPPPPLPRWAWVGPDGPTGAPEGFWHHFMMGLGAILELCAEFSVVQIVEQDRF